MMKQKYFLMVARSRDRRKSRGPNIPFKSIIPMSFHYAPPPTNSAFSQQCHKLEALSLAHEPSGYISDLNYSS
jgi:hypothetical protein